MNYSFNLRRHSDSLELVTVFALMRTDIPTYVECCSVRFKSYLYTLQIVYYSDNSCSKCWKGSKFDTFDFLLLALTVSYIFIYTFLNGEVEILIDPICFIIIECCSVFLFQK